LSGLHSVLINLSYRITLVMVITESEIVPIHVGSHGEVYRGLSLQGHSSPDQNIARISSVRHSTGKIQRIFPVKIQCLRCSGTPIPANVVNGRRSRALKALKATFTGE